jgi:Na+:H+ antiporter
MEAQTLSLVILLLVLLAVSRFLGEILEHFGQMAMIGEILAGIILGPAVLGVIHKGPELKVLSDLGVFMMVMLAGMELDFGDIGDALRGRGRWIPLINFFLPFASGLGLGLLLGMRGTQAMFLGLCIAITALPVAVRILMDLGWLQTDMARRIIGAAVLDDTIALLMLGVILGITEHGGVVMPVLTTLGKALVFMFAVFLVHWLVRYSTGHIPHSRHVVRWLKDNLKGRETLFALTLVFVLGFASISEAIGLHFVVGTFFGAMVLSHRVLGRENFEEVQKTASGVGMGFLAPIFFAALGLEFDVTGLQTVTVITVLLVAFTTKVIGGYEGGRLVGMSRGDSWLLGFGLNGRGIMELVIANVALSAGFIDQALFSTLVLMGIVTTLATPVLLKWAFHKAHPGETAPESAPVSEAIPAVDITHHEVQADPSTAILEHGHVVAKPKNVRGHAA